MPFALIPTALSICFFLVWTFIGGMILRDGQLAAQQEREPDISILPIPAHRMARASSASVAQASHAGRGSVVRAAS